MFVVVWAGLGAVPWAVADMQIRLKDGRVLTVPVDQDQIESITFGKSADGPAATKRPPAARAADKARQDAAHVRSAAEAAARAAAAAARADEAAATARAAAEKANIERGTAARAAAEAGKAAVAPPQPSAPRPSPRENGNATAGQPAAPRVLTVGEGGMFRVPSEAARVARDGDVVEIRAGTYAGDVAVWQARDLVLRGVGGVVRLEAAGMAAEGKGIWVIKGNDTTVENITFVGCRVPDLNGAGIRLEGAGLTVRRSRFIENEIGILTGNNPQSEVLVEYSEFGHNRIDYRRHEREGRSVAAPPGHNIYIGQVGRFTLRFSYMHHAVLGHNVKSRALRNLIVYNRIGDEKDGRSSYAIDLPNGGWSMIVGNLIQQGVHTDNSTMVSHGAERGNAPGALYVANNTFVNERGAGTFIFRRTAGPTLVMNNIFAGGGTVLRGSGTLRTNLVIGKGYGRRLPGGGREKIVALPGTGDLAGNLVADRAGFVDTAAYDYRLTAASPAIDAGADPGKAGPDSLVPVSVYSHPMGSAPRPKNGRIDIGAYEFTGK
jgi:hypothetical protein